MEKPIQKSSDKQHILLTSLGTRVFWNTEYDWKGEAEIADLAPLALIGLFDKLNLSIPDRFIAVVTEGAKNTTWPVFHNWICTNRGIKPESISVIDGRDTSEIRDILELVAQHIPEGVDLTLDVTQGFRHFPFIFYALVLYLKSLRGVSIRGVYYGMAEGIPQDDPKPIIDLQPLLELPEWFYAVRMFRDQGTTKPMADLLQPLADTLNQEKEELFKADKQQEAKKRLAQVTQVGNSVDGLKSYAFAYESALPLELEKASNYLVDSIGKLPTIIDSQDLPPLVGELTRSIVSTAQKTAFVEAPKTPKKTGLWKENIHLDEDELKRQAYMIDLYLERGQLSLAAGLMREWIVSWAIWKSGKTGEIENWLDNNKVRPRYERILGAIGASAKSGGPKLVLTTEQKRFRDFWHQLTDDLRNPLHHHGMRLKTVKTESKPLKSTKEFWNKLKTDGLKATGGIDLPPLGGRLLISPQGRRPGVLFSALKIANPDTGLVICSDLLAGSTHDAANAAGFKGHIEHIKLDDPLGGFNEIEKVTEHAKGYLLYADEVIANITGGSTLMGVIVQQLVEDAQKLDRPVQRFVLIDRRPPEDQYLDPFVQSGCHWLDN